MVAVIKSVDSKAYKAVESGWKHPEKILEDGTTVLIPETQWRKSEEELALGNSKALSSIFNGIDKNIFRLVQHCELAKEAWDILKTAHEGTSKVKMSRLQILTTKFENLKMKEDETIHEFYMNVCDISNNF